jgi:hypothetical protein
MNFVLHETSCSCPEQYDVYLDNKLVGYLRLRHGYFRAECPKGQIVHVAYPDGDGRFTEGERDVHLKAALVAIKLQLENMSVAYEIKPYGWKPE